MENTINKQTLAEKSGSQNLRRGDEAVAPIGLGIDAHDPRLAPAFILLDRLGHVVSMNDAAVCLTGFTALECIGRGLESLQRERPSGHNSIHGLLRRTSQIGSIHCELDIVHRSGMLVPVSVWFNALKVYGGDATDISYLVILKSISTANTQPRSETSGKSTLDGTWRIILALVADGIVTTDFDANVSYMNPAAERLTGWSVGEAIGRPEHEILCLVDDSIDPYDRGELNQHKDTIHHVLQSRNGLKHEIDLTVTPILDNSSTIVGTVNVFRDVTAKRQTEETLKKHESRDPLTNLANRYEFERTLGGLLELLQTDHQHAILYIDLDQFKLVNETCGHSAGDELLRRLAEVVAAKVRRSDLVARLGGDEFAVILEKCTIGDAQRTAHQLLWAIENFVFDWDAKRFKLTASIGVAALTPGQNVASAMSIVDRACQFAKDQGRNRIYVYQENDRDLGKRLRQMGWVPRLQDALLQNRFRIYLQPIVPLTPHIPDNLPHFEVLLRLIDEQIRIVLPGAFIPAAERYHQMASIDRWVLQAALENARDDRHANSVFALNLSGQTIGREDFLHFVLEELDQSGIDPARIFFEITESAAIQNFDRAIRLISTLKQRGCRFALDDFGVGISSLSYLKRLQVDFLKIDGSFVRGITKSATDLALVKAIQQVAQSLGIQTVAECIEDQETLDILRDLSVDFGQGYFIGMPNPVNMYGNSEPIGSNFNSKPNR